MNDSQHDYSRRLGKGMVLMAWVILLVLLTVFFNEWYEGQRNPNRELEGRITEQGVREVNLVQNRYGHYMASGRINGEPVTFLLDTGATRISIPKAVAERIGVQPQRPYRVNTANGTITVHSTNIERLELGNIVIHDVRGHINPGMDAEEILLGMNVLRQLELTQRGNKLTLRQYP